MFLPINLNKQRQKLGEVFLSRSQILPAFKLQ